MLAGRALGILYDCRDSGSGAHVVADLDFTVMRLEYDPKGDIAHIQVSLTPDVKVHHTERVGDGDEYERGIDYDADGQIVGYEFVNASHGLDLRQLPHQQQIADFIESVASLRIVQRAS
jgi:uncharacterized protein YuzE